MSRIKKLYAPADGRCGCQIEISEAEEVKNFNASNSATGDRDASPAKADGKA